MPEPDLAPGLVAAPASAADHHADFDAFYRREHAGLVRLASGLVDQRSRAEELVQDAFERTLLRWERLDNPGAFARTAVVNACRSELRRRAVARRFHPPSRTPLELPDPQDDLLRALARLSPRRRVAVVLRYFDDRSEADVAQLMGCRVGTVKSLVSRALAELRAEVER